MSHRNVGETTLAEISAEYFGNTKDFVEWMSVRRKEFGNVSGYELLNLEPSTAIPSIMGLAALTRNHLILENV